MHSSINRPLTSTDAAALYERMKPQAKAVLTEFNDGRFEQGQEETLRLRHLVNEQRTAASDAEDQHLNDLFVLDRYVDLLSKYGELWQRLLNGQFSDSWCSLQDCLDLLRVIKRFSEINVGFFETQLSELERAYPYSVFVSVGMLVERFECNICGLDIDSDECPHIRGSLYRGEMACGIARNIAHLDHVSLVTDPDDKRCVIQYDDASDHFKLVRLLAELVASKQWRPADFSHLRYSERRLPNPDYRPVGRNDLCSCGSGKKFKKCCIGNALIERKHVDLVAVPRSIESVVT
jgi:hypothetical protein